MLIALWLGITWIFYGDSDLYESKRNTSEALECPDVCKMADSIMQNIVDSKQNVTSAGELLGQCGVAKFIINSCWNQTNYGNNCLRHREQLTNEIKKFDSNYCSGSYLKGNDKTPCFWNWARLPGVSPCSSSLQQFIASLMQILPVKQQDTTPNNAKLKHFCCVYKDLLRCASKGTSTACKIVIEEFLEKFLTKMSGQTLIHHCRVMKFGVFNQCS